MADHVDTMPSRAPLRWRCVVRKVSQPFASEAAGVQPGPIGVACLIGTTATQATLLAVGDGLPVSVRFALASVAFMTFGALFIRPVRRATLRGVHVTMATGALLVVAMVAPSVSHDMWSYAMYGRMVSAHHASPFTHVPADFPHDPLFHLVGWRKTPSVYGPLFVAVAALGTSLTGPSVLWVRVFFRGVEALALVGAMLIIWRRTRHPAALAFVGLNPALIAVVADGHNDTLVGLALLAGVVLLSERRSVAAGTVLACGALVKIVVVLPLGAVFVWAWRRQGRTDALRMAVAAGACIAGAYMLAGGLDALRPVLDAAGARTSRASIWGLSALPTATFGGIAIVCTIAGVLVVSVMAVPRASAPWLVGAVLLCFLLGAPYVLPWYVAWTLPVVALVWWTPLAALAAVNGALLQLAYIGPRGAPRWFHAFYASAVPIGSLTEVIVLVVLAAWTRRSAGPARASDAGPAAAEGEAAGGSRNP